MGLLPDFRKKGASETFWKRKGNCHTPPGFGKTGRGDLLPADPKREPSRPSGKGRPVCGDMGRVCKCQGCEVQRQPPAPGQGIATRPDREGESHVGKPKGGMPSKGRGQPSEQSRGNGNPARLGLGERQKPSGRYATKQRACHRKGKGQPSEWSRGAGIQLLPGQGSGEKPSGRSATKQRACLRKGRGQPPERLRGVGNRLSSGPGKRRKTVRKGRNEAPGQSSAPRQGIATRPDKEGASCVGAPAGKKS